MPYYYLSILDYEYFKHRYVISFWSYHPVAEKKIESTDLKFEIHKATKHIFAERHFFCAILQAVSHTCIIISLTFSYYIFHTYNLNNNNTLSWLFRVSCMTTLYC